MKNWMKKLSDNINITEINIPGTHDSCTCKVRYAFIAKCQSKTIKEQLNSGIRFLDIRVEKEGSRLKLVHDIADCKLLTGKTSVANGRLQPNMALKS